MSINYLCRLGLYDSKPLSLTLYSSSATKTNARSKNFLPAAMSKKGRGIPVPQSILRERAIDSGHSRLTELDDTLSKGPFQRPASPQEPQRRGLTSRRIATAQSVRLLRAESS